MTLILRVNGHCGVSEQRLRPRRRHDERAVAALEWIANLPDAAVFFFGVDFKIGNGRAEHWIPVDQALSAINQPLLMEPDEDFGDGARHARVHGEVAPARALGIGERPVCRRAESTHLAHDRRTGMLLPFPHAARELLAPEIVTRLAFDFELALDDDLRGDSRM